MPAAHARVEALEFLRRPGPAVKRAGGGPPRRPLTPTLSPWGRGSLGTDEAEVAPRAAGQQHGLAELALSLRGFSQPGIRGENLARVPRAERVIERCIDSQT